MNKLKNLWDTFKGLGIITPLVLFSVIGPALGALLLISTSQQWFPQLSSLETKLQIPTYFILSILLVGLSLIPTHASSLIAGLLFGITLGPIMALVSIISSSLFSAWIAKLLIKEENYQTLFQRPAVAKVHHELLMRNEKKSVIFISLIRLSPAMPFAATNVILTAARAKLRHFFLGSSIGLAPRIIIVAVAGAGLKELDFSQGSNFELALIGGVSTIFLLFYIGNTVKKAFK